MGRPAWYSARKTVVLTWQMPPPSSLVRVPPLITKPFTKPVLASICPISSLKLNSWPGAMKKLSSLLAPTRMFFSRKSGLPA